MVGSFDEVVKTQDRGEFVSLSFYFHTRSLFSIACEPGIGRPAKNQFLAELNRRRCLHISVSFVVSIVLLVVSYCQCLTQSARRKYSQINVCENILELLNAEKTFWNHRKNT